MTMTSPIDFLKGLLCYRAPVLKFGVSKAISPPGRGLKMQYPLIEQISEPERWSGTQNSAAKSQEN